LRRFLPCPLIEGFKNVWFGPKLVEVQAYSKVYNEYSENTSTLIELNWRIIGEVKLKEC
jgi:hypothetical protein